MLAYSNFFACFPGLLKASLASPLFGERAGLKILAMQEGYEHFTLPITYVPTDRTTDDVRE
jgi:hypothetical protein